MKLMTIVTDDTFYQFLQSDQMGVRMNLSNLFDRNAAFKKNS